MTKDFYFNTAEALDKAKADCDKPVTPVEYIPVIKQARALDKKAENDRALGLDYEPAQQEPVAWMVDVDLANYQGQSEYRTILAWNAKPVWSGTHEINEVLKAVPLYTSPPTQRKPLTDEEIGAMWVTARRNSPLPHVIFARAIEAAHSIKENT